MSDAQSIRWGIIGPGGIARAFAGGLAHSRTGRLVAIGTRDPKRPGLAEAFPGARIHDGYGALLADPGIDAVYIANLHPTHAEWAIKTAEAGKHALVEKPIGMNAGETEKMIAAAQKSGTFLAEAFMYRCHPQTAKLIELVQSGVIGDIRLIRSSFGFNLAYNPAHRLYANALGGGGILDVGCYPVSMIRLLAGPASGRPFADPIAVTGMAHLTPERADDWASALLQFDTGIIGEASCSVGLQQDNTLRVLGSKGRIEVKDFWFAGGRQGGIGRIEIITGDDTQTVEVNEPGWLYSFEADAAAAAIRAGSQQLDSPGMSWADTLGNMKVLDQWRAAAGVHYDFE